MRIEPFQPQHLKYLSLQPSQIAFSNFFDDEYALSLKDSGPSFTAIDKDEVVACAGIVSQWNNRAIAWALISGMAGRNFVAIHRAVNNFLNLSDVNRIEAYVDANFDAGHRWITMLGFKSEGLMRQFMPDGNDAVLYARLKDG
jgi:RimJ/RimL family protein N-acetyltransferase